MASRLPWKAGEGYVRRGRFRETTKRKTSKKTGRPAPANEHNMELLMLMGALKRASADHLTVVLPYYG